MNEGVTNGGTGEQSPALPAPNVYRCEYKHCGAVVLEKHIAQGGCIKCGGRRLSIAISVTEEEAEWMKSEGYVFDKERWSDKPFTIQEP